VKPIYLTSLYAASALCCAILVPAPAGAQMSPNVTLYASGLEGPRGLRFGPDGNLYVAEAGTAGSQSTNSSQCAQVPSPVGPYHSGNTARISKIDGAGHRMTVADGFPSSMDSLPTPGIEGVADIAFLDGQLYAVTAGGGCSHGSMIPNSVVRVDLNTHNWSVVANLSDFLQTHPDKYPNAADYEPDGTFYGMIAKDGLLYTVEPNHGQVFSISRGGDVKEVIDISENEGHIVPTSIAVHHDTFYVGNLGSFPVTPNASKILKLGECDDHAAAALESCEDRSKLHVAGSRAGFTTVVATDFGPDGLLYVLELSSVAGFPTPGAGKVVRITRQGVIEDVATGLVVPTGMTFGPDGQLYVSNFGAAPPGTGQIVRISIK
jgi:hypothetical protein